MMSRSKFANMATSRGKVHASNASTKAWRTTDNVEHEVTTRVVSPRPELDLATRRKRALYGY